ncbi:hypothetical protein RF11_08582 [Thelohanellus kitauei]|uniref:Uncharacterized protein n=1 Tax=Thelohanellus kitauei TaxID=669202 RepID=A0A0C2MLF6_THEKT|nr:hypothetical protein RF11_08582 [Thelohanellus kitauei]
MAHKTHEFPLILWDPIVVDLPSSVPSIQSDILATVGSVNRTKVLMRLWSKSSREPYARTALSQKIPQKLRPKLEWVHLQTQLITMSYNILINCMSADRQLHQESKELRQTAVKIIRKATRQRTPVEKHEKEDMDVLTEGQGIPS